MRNSSRDNWWQTAFFYQPRANLKFRQLAQQVVRYKQMGVDAVYLDEVLDADYPYGAVNNFYKFSADKGEKEDFLSMLDAFHREEIAVVVRMRVDCTTLENNLFKLEETRNECYPISEEVGPWKDENGKSLWHGYGGKFYLSHHGEGYPLLDWHSPVLRAKMGKAVRYLLNLGIDGIVFAGIDSCMYDSQGNDDYRTLTDLNLKVVRFLRDLVAERGNCCSLGELDSSATADKYEKYSFKSFNLLFRQLERSDSLEVLDNLLDSGKRKFLYFATEDSRFSESLEKCFLAYALCSSDNFLLQDNLSENKLQMYKDDKFFAFILALRKNAVLGIDKLECADKFRGFLLKGAERAIVVGINFGEKEFVWKDIATDDLVLQSLDFLGFADSKIEGKNVVVAPMSLIIGEIS